MALMRWGRREDPGDAGRSDVAVLARVTRGAPVSPDDVDAVAPDELPDSCGDGDPPAVGRPDGHTADPEAMAARVPPGPQIASARGYQLDAARRLVGDHAPHHLVAIKGLIGGSLALLVALALRVDFTITPSDASEQPIRPIG